jgi:NADH:ubiquinone oxidoreductase subunit 3 (subunit A)
VIVAILFAGSALLVSVLVGKTGKRTPAKDTAYECGMLPQYRNRLKRGIQDRLPRFGENAFSVEFMVKLLIVRSGAVGWQPQPRQIGQVVS